MIFKPNSNLRNRELTLFNGISIISAARFVHVEKDTQEDGQEDPRSIADEEIKKAKDLTKMSEALDYGTFAVSHKHGVPHRSIYDLIEGIEIPAGIADEERKKYLEYILKQGIIEIPGNITEYEEKLDYIDRTVRAGQELKELRKNFEDNAKRIIETGQLEEQKSKELIEKNKKINDEDKTNTEAEKKLLTGAQEKGKIKTADKKKILEFRFYNGDELTEYLVQNTKLGEKENVHLINTILQLKENGKIQELEKELDDYKRAGLIAGADRQKVLDIPITPKEFEKYLRAKTNLEPQEIKQLIEIKGKEHELEKQFDEVNKEMGAILRSETEKVTKQAQMDIAIEKNSAGIEIKPNTELVYTEKDWEIDEAVKKRIQIVERDNSLNYAQKRDLINKIIWKYRESISRRTIGKRKAAIKNVSGLDEYNVLVHLALYDESGKSQPLTLTLSEFEKWVQEHDAYQDIKTTSELQKRINFQNEGIGIDIKPGTVVEIDEMDTMDEHPYKSKTPKKITIKDINEQDGTITLNQPVLFKTDALFKNEKFAEKQTLSYGEFLRWFLANKAVKDYSSFKNPLEELQNDLNKLNYNLNKKFQRNPAQYPSVELKPGEILYYNDGSDTKFQIKDVDKDKILLASGAAFTLPQFFRWIKNNHVEKHNPDAEAEKTRNLMLAMDKSKEEAKKEAEKTKNDIDKNKGKDEKNAKNNDPNKDAERVSSNYFKDLWHNTAFLSFKDCIEMAKATWEFVKRKNEVWGKQKYSAAGMNLPGRLGTEFKRINQQAENDEVNQYKEGFEQRGVDEIKNILYKTRSAYEAKACFITLSEKGQIRWDDKDMWNTLDKLSGCRALNGFKIKVEDDCEKVIDYLWGTDTWAHWYNSNDSNYKSRRDQFKEIGKKVDSDPKNTGGLVGECQRMLHEFLQGKYVDPAQYEAMIEYAIDAGKMLFEDKLFFIVMGIGAENIHGKTLLSRDRVDVIDGDLLTKFPVLDFFVHKTEGKGWTVDNYKEWINKYVSSQLNWKTASAKELKYTEKFRREFVEKFVLKNRNFIYRLEKTSRYSENWDHDDMHIFGALLDDESISRICSSQSGTKASVTVEGHKNIYAGFNQQLRGMMQTIQEIRDKKGEYKEMSEEDLDRETKQELRRIAKLLKAQIRFDSIMQNRYEQWTHSLSRLTPEKMNSTCIVGGDRLTKEYRDEVADFIRRLAESDFYQNNLRGIDIDTVYDMSNTHTHERNKITQKQSKMIDTFGKTLGDAITADIQFNNGENLLRFIKNNLHTVTGLPDAEREDLEKQKRIAEAAAKREEIAVIDVEEQKKIAKEYIETIEHPPTREEITARERREEAEKRERLRTMAGELVDGRRSYIPNNDLQEMREEIEELKTGKNPRPTPEEEEERILREEEERERREREAV